MSTNKCRTDGVAYDCSKLNSKEIQLWSMYQTSASFLVQAGDLHVLISCQLTELSGIISFLKYNGHCPYTLTSLSIFFLENKSKR